jgi:segregation and condensation protein A
MVSAAEEIPQSEYTVRLEQLFQGPMDLLLHLVREAEVDIHEVEIHSLVDGYLGYLNRLKEFDIELAGDFVLMAATLMAIKSRSLLPREEVDLEEELDPRDELIQRLIEYRHFKEASRDLEERREARAQVVAHAWRAPSQEEPTLDVSDLTAWDLLSAWTRLLRETLAGRKLHIDPDERPLRYYVEELVSQLKTRRELSLTEIVRRAVERGDAGKAQVIGTFCALLELMKIGIARAWQPDSRGDITIVLRDDLGADIDEVVRNSGFDDEAVEEQRERPEVVEPSLFESDASAAELSEELSGEPPGGPAPA